MREANEDHSLSGTVQHVPGRARPWQLCLVGNGASEIGTERRDALGMIFDLVPALPALTIRTTAGCVRVTCDFPSGCHRDVDRD
ncbi:MAG: hypothetical protein KGL65_10545, partial [Rhodospirillales bacterium]|nr:hypothetical protein [Rhodospirillales bacterium]